jgi:hypothetical protein
MSGDFGDTPFDLDGPSDLYAIDFAGRAGATAANPARPVAGASDPSRAEYYPAISPDGDWLAFNAIGDNGKVYDNPSAELHLVQARVPSGSIRLSANDPPACSGKASPGVTNSWPKWAPEVKVDKGRKFYFLVFSSKRHLKTERPQLYVAPVVIDAQGLHAYRALYFTNQESEPSWETWGNHTPAWDSFVIPPAVIK